VTPERKTQIARDLAEHACQEARKTLVRVLNAAEPEVREVALFTALCLQIAYARTLLKATDATKLANPVIRAYEAMIELVDDDD